MGDWQDISTAPEGLEIETKIDDADGVRNVQTLFRHGSLFFTDADLSFYVYYRPTHWRPPTETSVDV